MIILIVISAIVIYIPINSIDGNDGNNSNNIIPPTEESIDGDLPTPPDGECYLSVGLMYQSGCQNITQNIADQLSSFSEMVGKNETVFFDVWGDLWNNQIFWQLNYYRPLLEAGMIKAIGVNVWPCVGPNDDNTVKEIADGKEDAFITQQAEEVKAFGYPVFIRFGAEFNIYEGETYPGQPANETYTFGENSTDFVNAWLRYVDIFRSLNVTNAIFVWNPNFADFGPYHWTAYYPGNEYVDWVGIDLYQYTNDSNPASMIQGVYDDYSSEKPVAIIEWGANWVGENYSDNDRATFITDFFNAVAAMPDIKLIDYWYYQDFKFDMAGMPNATLAYISGVSNPRYIG